MMTIFRKAGTGYQKGIFGKSSGIFLFEITGTLFVFLRWLVTLYSLSGSKQIVERKGARLSNLKTPVPDSLQPSALSKDSKVLPNSTFSWGQNVQAHEPIGRHVTFRPQE